MSGTFQEPLSKARRDEVGQSRCEKIARRWPVRLRRLLCGKPAAFRQVAEAKEFNPKPEGPEGAEPFRTVPVGLWADPVVTRKFHVASRRINNLRELSGEQAAEPRGLFLRRRPGVERSDSRTLACAVPR